MAPAGNRVNGRAPRNQGTCKSGFRKVAKMRMVCAKIGGRTCKSGSRDANGRCKRAALSAEQKARKKVLAKAYRMRKRNLAKREGGALSAAFSALKKVRREARKKNFPSMIPRRSLRSGGPI